MQMSPSATSCLLLSFLASLSPAANSHPPEQIASCSKMYTSRPDLYGVAALALSQMVQAVQITSKLA